MEMHQPYEQAAPLPDRPVEARPVDLVHLARHTLGDRSLEREVLQLFQRQSRVLVERMRRAPGLSEWCEAAHTMRGSARGIGAWRIAEAAAEAERLPSCECSARVDILAAIESEVTAANAYIAHILSPH